MTTALEDLLVRHVQAGTIPGAVAVLGTTEFGTVDPVHEVIACRDRPAAIFPARALKEHKTT